MTKKISAKNRKTNILIGLTQGEISFLDRKINKKDKALSSRSAIVRFLVCRAMENPKLLDVV